MNSILRAQQRETAWPFEVYDCDETLLPLSMPKSPDHRIRRAHSSSQHSIDIVPTFENPCRPCRIASPRPSRSTSCFSKFITISPYLSIACFIAILVWEICSLHTEVYKLQHSDNFRRAGSPSSSATYLRRIQYPSSLHENNQRRTRESQDLAHPHIQNTLQNQYEDHTHQTVTSTPIPPLPLSMESEENDNINNLEQRNDFLEEIEEEERREFIQEEEELRKGGRQYNNNNRIGIVESEPASYEKNKNTGKPKLSDMEEQLAELMKTRELLKSTRRKPSPESVPLSQLTNPHVL
mmetsp:Transcript_52869/g.67807  ORF Transcript_52869/g.67807 Transcript_52869/m.67807 type:complete len:295 (-) Transcript_52869:100-984(-)